MNASPIPSDPMGHPGEVIDFAPPNVKYLHVEIKTPGFAVYRGVVPIRNTFTVRGLIDRINNLHPEVEATVKECGYMFPPIEFEHLRVGFDLVINRGKSKWIRVLVIDKPTDHVPPPTTEE